MVAIMVDVDYIILTGDNDCDFCYKIVLHKNFVTKELGQLRYLTLKFPKAREWLFSQRTYILDLF